MTSRLKERSAFMRKFVLREQFNIADYQPSPEATIEQLIDNCAEAWDAAITSGSVPSSWSDDSFRKFKVAEDDDEALKGGPQRFPMSLRAIKTVNDRIRSMLHIEQVLTSLSEALRPWGEPALKSIAWSFSGQGWSEYRSRLGESTRTFGRVTDLVIAMLRPKIGSGTVLYRDMRKAWDTLIDMEAVVPPGYPSAGKSFASLPDPFRLYAELIDSDANCGVVDLYKGSAECVVRYVR